MIKRGCSMCLVYAALSAIQSNSCGEFLTGPSVVQVRVRFSDNSSCLGDVSNADDVTCSVQSRLTFTLSRCRYHDVTTSTMTSLPLPWRHWVYHDVTTSTMTSLPLPWRHWVYHDVAVSTMTSLVYRLSVSASSSSSLSSSYYHRVTVSDRTIGVAAARVWNTLPADVTSSSSLPVFKRRLKTFLYTNFHAWLTSSPI